MGERNEGVYLTRTSTTTGIEGEKERESERKGNVFITLFLVMCRHFNCLEYFFFFQVNDHNEAF